MTCYGQEIDTLNITNSDNPSYPYQLDLRGYGISTDQFADISDVHGLYGKKDIQITFSDGIVYFASRPEELNYNYVLNFNGTKQDMYVMIYDGTPIEINAENFPDKAFRELVSRDFDQETDGKKDGVLSYEERTGYGCMYAGNRGISSLKGIEYLTGLWELNCYGNNLTSFDLSRNTNLETLNCYENQLTTLDVSKLTALTSLNCFLNKLTEIDVSKCLSLKGLDCSYNQIRTIDLSKNKELTGVTCNNQEIEGLVLTATGDAEYPYQTALSMYFSADELPKVSFVKGQYEGNLDIETLYSDNIAYFMGKPARLFYEYATGCGNFVLEGAISRTVVNVTVDAANFPDEKFREYVSQYWGDELSEEEIDSVTRIDVNGYGISSFKGIEYFTALTGLDCRNNRLTELDVSNNTALTELDCSDNQLTELDVSKNTALIYLFCYNNKLTELDLRANTALTDVACSNNQLTDLDVTKNKVLTRLLCDGNKITALDVSNNTALTELYCYDNQLAALDVSKNTALTTLYCYNNKLTELDVSKNTALTQLYCSGNKITVLDVRRCPKVYINCDEGVKVIRSDAAKPEITTETTTRTIPTDTPFYLQLEASGTTPITWSKTGTLPTGLNLSSSGLISGTPKSAQTKTFKVTAKNKYGNDTKSFTITTYVPVSITTAKLADGTTDKTYSAVLKAKGSNVTWSATGLPDGFSINAKTGKISGKTSSYGEYSVVVRAENSLTNEEKTFTLKIKGVAPTISGTLKTPELNKSYSSAFTVKGTSPIEWSISGNLPDGLTFDTSTGTISGTPKSYSKAGYKVTITATGPSGSKSKTVTLKVKGTAPTFSGTLKQPEINKAYSSGFTVKGSDTIALSMSGELPDGLTFDKETGIISGTPKSYQKSGYKITITATNPVGSKSKTVTLKVKGTAPTFSGTLKQPEINKAYSSGFTVKGSDTITLSMSGELPDGLTFDKETGIISGTPKSYQKSGFKITITATNPVGSKSKTVTLKVKGTAPTFSGTLKQPEIYKEYSSGFTVKGSDTITLSMSGKLPDGLTFNEETGVISGTPTSYSKSGYKFTITATNPVGSKSKTVTLKVKATAPTISGTLKQPELNKAYSSGLTAKGTQPIEWSISGNLPDGLTFDTSTGTISGKPTSYLKAGYKITITATNIAGSKSKTVTLKVKGTAPVIKTAKLPNATQWSSYSVELNATGSDTITWRADGLPDGLSLNGNTIEGTPTVSGNKSVTIYAKNPVSEVKKKLTLKIAAAEKAETNDDTKSPKDTQTTPADPDDEESDTPEEPEEEAAESPQDDEEDAAHSEGEYVIVAELGEISRDVEGLYDFSVVLSDDAVAGAELVYIANSSEPSSDDEIAEFFDETGKETSEVPESRHITISIWLRKNVIYNPAVAVRN